MYSVKEAFYSLQGEGTHTGRPAIFCRFTGCNLWSGKETHRSTSECQFCDTDFIGTDGQNGGKFRNAFDLAQHLQSLWPVKNTHKYVVFTGGEPALQLDSELINAMHSLGFEIAIETNGTLPLPEGIDWICVSPKTTKTLIVNKGNELKLVYPQEHLPPQFFTSLDFDYFYLQPMDQSHLPEDRISPEATQNLTLRYCLHNPQWRLSLQTHKMLNID
ncbi:7-carboxy-7-deazaguanine synthase [Marinomonas sp. 2405UD68-3]|uniref:7-carboxy-7-deazaguanine synthase n=1 Tax=Marinomonas sp. 2405UD68-3 TaxID=3391835 RepID=UPI0039C91E47